MQVKINLEETICTACQRGNGVYIDTAKYFKIYKLQKYCRVIYWEISKTHKGSLVKPETKWLKARACREDNGIKWQRQKKVTSSLSERQVAAERQVVV
jgi:hypothetical protein